MDYLVIIPILALLGLQFVSLGGKRPSLKSAAMVWVIGLLLFAVGRTLVPEEVLFRDSEVTRRVQSQLRHLRKQKGWAEHPIIILEGSSLSLVGIDGEALEKKLREAGREATVLQFNLAGGNHVERLHLLESFFDSLNPKEREKFRQTRVILLSEVMKRYDKHPLVFMTKDEYTDRARVYLNPQNTWTAWELHRADAAPEEDTIPVLVENAFANTFAIGTFSDMKIPGRIPGIGGYFPLKKADPNFDLERARQAVESLPPATELAGENPFPWWNLYYEKLREQSGEFIDHAAFYGMPTMDREERIYQSVFRNRIPRPAVMLQPDSKTYAELNRKDAWFDPYHVQEKGAEMTTEWLAQEIIRHWDDLTKAPWGETDKR